MLADWKYHKKLIIDHTKIDEDLTNFPVLVKLDSTNFDFSKAQSTGNDIRFALEDDTLLSYERERHDSVNQVAEYWVKIPTVSSTTDTIFYIYYGNSSASDGEDPTNVWDSNFKFVSHMKDNPDNSHIKDSTTNANNGTKYAVNQPIEVNGQIGKAQSFDGSDDYITVANNELIANESNSTVGTWIKWDGTTGERAIYSEDKNGTDFHLSIKDGVLSFGIYHSGWSFLNDSVAISQNEWHYTVGVLSSSDGMKIYVDGIEKGTNSNTSPNDSSITKSSIGRYLQDGYNFSGIIDEVRLSTVARSPAWIKATYYSENNALVSYGVERATSVNALMFGINF